MPIYGHTYIVHNLVIFGPIPIFFIKGCSRDDSLLDRLLFWWMECIIEFSSRRRPFTVTAVAKGVETPRLHQKFPLWVGLFLNPYFQTEFRLNPLPPPPPTPTKIAIVWKIYFKIHSRLLTTIILIHNRPEI